MESAERLSTTSSSRMPPPSRAAEEPSPPSCEAATGRANGISRRRRRIGISTTPTIPPPPPPPPAPFASTTTTTSTRSTRRRTRRAATATISTTTTSAPSPRILLALLLLLCLAYSAIISAFWPPAAPGVFAVQLSTATTDDSDDDVASQEPSPRGLVDVEENSECNTTLYDEWYDSPYSGALLTDVVDFWIFSDAELTNGQALEVISSSCRVIMDTLRLDRGGRSGPVPDKHIYDAMCASECTLSDSIREEAMDLSGCSCLQLSTQPSDATYHTEGDWCVANSGRILCETFGQCGAWGCRISDFMCPRYEYNKQTVPHRGQGDCSGAKGTWARRGRSSRKNTIIATTTTTMMPSLVAFVALAAVHWYQS